MQLKRAGEGAGFVMIDAETSYMPSGSFSDMKERIAGQYHLEPGRFGGTGGKFRGLQHRRS
jgi:hypothetical protein